MTNTTTIGIPEELRDELKERKKHPKEPYYAVIERALGDEGEQSNNNLTERLDSLESAVKEATQAAQSADKKLEDLQ